MSRLYRWGLLLTVVSAPFVVGCIEHEKTREKVIVRDRPADKVIIREEPRRY